MPLDICLYSSPADDDEGDDDEDEEAANSAAHTFETITSLLGNLQVLT